MNKIFYGLLIFTVVGLGVLFWLMRNAPSTDAEVKVEGVTIVDTEKKADEHGEAHEGEHPPEHAAESTHAAEHADVAKDAHAPAPHAPEAAAPAHADAHAEKPAASAAAVAPQKAKKLAIATEPSGATVYVNGNKTGVTPLEIDILEKEQSIKLEAVGFESFERESPSLETPGVLEAPLVTWKVQLIKNAGASKTPVAKAHAKATKTPAAKKAVVTPSMRGFNLVGHSGPFFIQLKSLQGDTEKVTEQREQFQALLGSASQVYACDVNIPGKGKWTRLVAGPFNSRAAAKKGSVEASAQLKDRYPDFEEPIVTASQNCL